MTTKSEAVAVIKDALTKAYNLGQRYWQQADSDYESDHKKSDVTAATFKNLFAETDTSMREVLDYIAAQDAEIARLREVVWTMAEHNALHFGESHNTVIQARAALTTKGTR